VWQNVVLDSILRQHGHMMLAAPAFAALHVGKGVHNLEAGCTRSGHRCSVFESLPCAALAERAACSIGRDPHLEREESWEGLFAQMYNIAKGHPRQPLHVVA
jgi:hypothetical protein